MFSMIRSLAVRSGRAFTWVKDPEAWRDGLLLVTFAACMVLLVSVTDTCPLLLWSVGWGLLIVAIAVVSWKGWFSPFGPICMYDLVRAGRKRRVIIYRCLYLVVLLIVLGSAWSSVTRSSNTVYMVNGRVYSSGGKEHLDISTLIYAALGLQLVVAMFVTPAVVASALCQEKERKRLEFLLLT